MLGTARLYAKHYFRPWVYGKEQSNVSVTPRSSQSLGWKAWGTSSHASMWTSSSCLCWSEWVWDRESGLDREGQEFRHDVTGMVCLCSLMSEVSPGMASRLRLESSEDFFTHPAEASTRMPWTVDSAGSVNWSPYMGSLHMTQAFWAGQLNSKREHSESDHFMRTKQKLHNLLFFLTQNRKLPSSTSTLSIGPNSHQSVQTQGERK